MCVLRIRWICIIFLKKICSWIFMHKFKYYVSFLFCMYLYLYIYYVLSVQCSYLCYVIYQQSVQFAHSFKVDLYPFCARNTNAFNDMCKSIFRLTKLVFVIFYNFCVCSKYLINLIRLYYVKLIVISIKVSTRCK